MKFFFLILSLIPTCFKLNIRVLDIVMGQYLVWRSNRNLIFSTGPSLEVEPCFSGTSMLFRIRTPKSYDKNNIKS